MKKREIEKAIDRCDPEELYEFFCDHFAAVSETASGMRGPYQSFMIAEEAIRIYGLSMDIEVEEGSFIYTLFHAVSAISDEAGHDRKLDEFLRLKK